MRLKDYFAGIPIVLHSPLSPDAVKDRINNSAGSIFWPFNFGVVGRVRFHRVSLRFRSSLSEYNGKPVLVGRLIEQSPGSTLHLRYRAPVTFYLFYPFWYSLLALFGAVLIGGIGQRNPDLSNGDLALTFVGWAFMLTVPLGRHYFGTRNSEEELSEILEFLANEAEAKPQPSS
jgi:hypothetical protein